MSLRTTRDRAHAMTAKVRLPAAACVAVAIAMAAWSAAGLRASTPVSAALVPEPGVETISERAPSLRPDVLRLALNATACAARQGLVRQPTLLTVIDYSLPSTEPRLWVVDLASLRVLFAEVVAHGRNSGENLTTRFSNRVGSFQTSLGLFVTGDTYVGRNGYSLRLTGLEEGINHRARDRAIVMHGAPYVNPDLAKRVGRLGRSQGCPAVREGVARTLIDTIRGGSAVFAYYPDQAWLTASKFLGACGTNASAAVADGSS